MNTKNLKQLVILLAFAAAGGLALGKDVTLVLGNAAPKLQNGTWVQGEPVKEFQKGKAYIVEFWATWCGPCRVSIPHLNEIYAKFKDKDLIVVGQDVWERDDKLVEPFVKNMADKMTYRVALDDKSESKKGTMAETWMDAAGRTGIPSAFLINKQGKVAWIGHPMQLQESLIEEVLADKQDLAKAAADYEINRKAEANKSELNRTLTLSLANKKWDEAESAYGKLKEITPKAQLPNLEVSRIQILLGRKEIPVAHKAAMELSNENLNANVVQTRLASIFSTAAADSKGELLDLAVTFASRANDAAKGKNSFTLAALAQLTFKQGKQDKAIEIQQQAIDNAEGKYKESLEKTLASYKAGELPKSVAAIPRVTAAKP